jgi:K+-sensing histidine kinase KdpD
MERVLLRLLGATPRYPVWARYVLTLGLVGIAFSAKLLLYDALESYPLLLFIPVVFLASVIFDRGSGVLATIASAILAAAYFVRPPASSAIIPLAVFVLTALFIAAVTETLRGTLEELSEAKSYGDILLRELAHRTRNDLATIMSILRLQARSDSNPAVQAAIASAAARVDVVAKVHDRLRVVEATGSISRPTSRHCAEASRISTAECARSRSGRIAATFPCGVRKQLRSASS